LNKNKGISLTKILLGAKYSKLILRNRARQRGFDFLAEELVRLSHAEPLAEDSDEREAKTGMSRSTQL
jgi:hypothetical protein